MATAVELLRQGRRDELWKKYCGFLDLSLEEFMRIQKRLLLEQIQLLSNCELGRKLLVGQKPTSVEEFRETVPLTTYEDYAPFLLKKREDVLPTKPLHWARTTGRSGEFGYRFKWVPVSDATHHRSMRYGLAALILASCTKKGEVVLEEGDKLLYNAAPRPYASGESMYGLAREFPFKFLPPLDKAESLSFEERVQEGFKLAFRDGIDFFAGVSSVFVAVGERFAEASRGIEFSPTLLHPKSLFRLGKALLKSKSAKRRMLPKDLWTLKGVVGSGTDTAIYSHRIHYLWGKRPLGLYSATEAGFVAVQAWNYKGMTFVPDINFFEFIPEKEHIRSKKDPQYRPRTLLLDQVKPGEKYEIVFTSLGGGCFVRYRIGDMIRIVSRKDEELGIDIPQMQFESRCDDIIDLAAFTRLTETIIWRAIEDIGIPYQDWVVRKEEKDGQPALHIFIETKLDQRGQEKEIAKAMHQALKRLDPDYRDMEEIMGLRPVVVTLLSPGTFHQYYLERQAAEVDLGQLKPPHIQPPDRVLNALLRISQKRSA